MVWGFGILGFLGLGFWVFGAYSSQGIQRSVGYGGAALVDPEVMGF